MPERGGLNLKRVSPPSVRQAGGQGSLRAQTQVRTDAVVVSQQFLGGRRALLVSAQDFENTRRGSIGSAGAECQGHQSVRDGPGGVRGKSLHRFGVKVYPRPM